MSNNRKRRWDEKRCYGYFYCDQCDRDWESAHVYVAYGTKEPLYEQECKNCGTAHFPYDVERLRCSECQQTHCICSYDGSEFDFLSPHPEELCLRCRSGRKCTTKRYR